MTGRTLAALAFSSYSATSSSPTIGEQVRQVNPRAGNGTRSPRGRRAGTAAGNCGERG